MDPTATLALLLSALNEGDREVAAQAARDLSEWLESDGFLPNLNEALEDALLKLE
jgi:hypothetical protein